MSKIKNSLIKIFVAGVLAAGLSVAAYAQTYTGNFTLPEGSNFDGGDRDAGWATTYYNGSTYVVGSSSSAIGLSGLLVKYDGSGVWVSSAVLPGVDFKGVAVNANGIYVVGTSDTDMVTAKYDQALVLVSSRVVGFQITVGADIALSAAGNVFVVGSDLTQLDSKIVMYDANLALQSENGIDSAGGVDTGVGVAVDGTNVYMGGYSLKSGATYFVLAKFDESSYLSSYSSTSLSGVYLDATIRAGGKLAVNPVTHEVYAALNLADAMMVVKYDQYLVKQGTQTFYSPFYAQASDVVLDSTGNVYLAGAFNSGADDYAVMLKYNPNLLFLSSAASVQTYGYEATSVALDTATGYGYVTGVYFSDGSGNEPGWDMRTVRLGPLGDGGGAQQPEATFSGNFGDTELGAVFGLTSDLEADNLAVDNYTAGGPFVYIVGYASNLVSGKKDGYIIKYSSDGVKLSSAAITQPGYDFTAEAVKVSSEGFVYVAGGAAAADSVYSLVVKYTPSLVVVTSVTHGGYDLTMALGPTGEVVVGGFKYISFYGHDAWYITKYDSALNYVTNSNALSFASFDSTETVQGLALDSAGNIYAVGNKYDNSFGNYGIQVIKANPGMTTYSTIMPGDGLGIGVDILGNKNLGHASVLVDAADNLYVIHPSTNAATGLATAIRKYDTVPDLIGYQTFDSAYHDEPLTSGFDRYGNLLVSGWSFNDQRVYQGGFLLLYNPELVLITSGPMMAAGLDADMNRDYVYTLAGGGPEVHTFRFNLPSAGNIFSGGVYEAGGALVSNLFATGVAYYGSEVYSVGVNGTDSLLVRYNMVGNLVSSAVFTGAEFRAVKANANGVYLAGGGMVAKYDHSSGLVLSSAAVLPGDPTANDLVLDEAGNVYVAASETGAGGSDFKLVKFDSDLTYLTSVTQDFGGFERGFGVDVDTVAGRVYIAGTSLQGPSTFYMSGGYNTGDLGSPVFSAPYGGVYSDPEMNLGAKLAVNPVTHDVFLVGSLGTENDRKILTLKYNQNLTLSSAAAFPGGMYQLGMDVKVSSEGYVYVLGKDDTGGYDSTALLKYDENLVFLSSSAQYVPGVKFVGLSLALHPDLGDAYAAGVLDAGSGTNMFTARFEALPGVKYVPPLAFTGLFAEATGVTVNGGGMDMGTGAAVYGSYVYAVGHSAPAGSVIVKYDQTGNVASSATYSGAGFMNVVANGDGVYVAAQGDGTGFVTLKYTHSLVLSSAAVLPGDSSARDIALDASGNVYVIGSNMGEGGNDDYKIVKYDQYLAQQGAPGLFDAGGYDEGRGIAVDNGFIYVTGDSLMAGATYFVTAKLNSSYAVVASTVYAGAYVSAEFPMGEKLAINPVTHNVYLAANASPATMLILKYDQDLVPQAEETVFSTSSYAHAAGIKLDASGDIHVAGSYSNSLRDIPLLLKYDPQLVLLSSAAKAQPYNFEVVGLALDTTTGSGYLPGVYFSDGNGGNQSMWDMRTVKMDPLPGTGVYGVITGTVSYDGMQTGESLVAIFTSTDIINSNPYTFATINTAANPWDYTTPNLPAGTYYLLGIILTQGMEAGPQKYDPWDVLGSTDNMTAVVISEAGVQPGINLALVDGTDENPNPVFTGGYIKGAVSYSGAVQGVARVALSSAPLALGSSENIITNMLVGANSYEFGGLTMPGTYYITAWLDENENSQLDCGESNGAYRPTRGVDCAFESRPIFLAENTALAGADITVTDFVSVTGSIFKDMTMPDGNGVFMATQSAAGYVPFYMGAYIAGTSDIPYEFRLSTSAAPYDITLYIDENEDLNRGFFEAYGSTAGVLVAYGSPVTGADIILSTPIIPVPSLDWAGGMSYNETGVPDGYSGLFVYRVKYTSPNNLAPANGYPKVNIAYDGVPLSSSPFTMTALAPEDTDYSDGKMFTYTWALSAGSGSAGYSYQFAAYDSDNIPAVGPAAEATDGPLVSEPPAITYATTTHVLSGITAQVITNGMSGAQRLARDTAGNIYSAQEDSGILVLTRRTGSGVTQTTFVEFGGATLKDLAVDPFGNSYILAGTGESPLVAKFGTSGEELWISTFGYGADPVSLGVSTSGVVYAAANDTTDRSILLYKLKPDGSEVWETPVRYQYAQGASTDTVAHISVVPQSNVVAIYVAGAVSTGPMVTSGLLAKFIDNGGAVTLPAWVKLYSSASRDEYSEYRYAVAKAVAADKNGNVYVAGTDNRYDAGQGTDVWLLKYNSGGFQQWASAKTFNSDAYADDDVAALALDSIGDLYVSGGVVAWSSGGFNLWVAKYSSGGVRLLSRTYDYNGNSDYGYDVIAGSAAVYTAAEFDGASGLYELPLSIGAQSEYFTAAEGPNTGSVSLAWNYPVPLPEGSTFYVQYSSAAVPNWATVPLVTVSTGVAQWESQEYLVGGLMTGRDASQNIFPQYKFRVSLRSSAGIYTVLVSTPSSYARTPFAYDSTLPYGTAKFSYMHGTTAGENTGNAIAVSGSYVYQAFGNDSGDSVGLGFRKHNTNTSAVEWTKFFNTAAGAYFSVNALLRDSAGSFYAVGSRASIEDPANTDFWIGKFNADGDLIGSYSQDVDGGSDELFGAVLDGAGGLYTAGKFTDVTGENGGEISVRKYNVAASSPYLLWASTQSGSGAGQFVSMPARTGKSPAKFGQSGSGDDAAYGIALDVNNSRLYVTGAITVEAGNTDLWAARYTLDNHMVSSFTYNTGSGNAAGYGVAVAPSGVFVAGSRSNGSGTPVMYVAQYSLDFSTTVWDMAEGPDSESALHSVVVDANGYGYGAGFESSWEQEGLNAIFGKLAPNGNIVWNRYFNDDARNVDEAAYSIVLDTANRVFSSIRTGSYGSFSPGFYMFPQPSFNMTAAEYHVPGAVSLTWLSQATLPAGTTFYVQYATNNVTVVWSAAAAQESFITDKPLWESGQMEYKVYGLDNGKNALGAAIGPDYYFRVWYSTGAGSYTAVPGIPAAKAANAYMPESTLVYSGDNRLYTAGVRYMMDNGLTLNGAVRGPLGNIYSVVNAMQGESSLFALRKLSPGGLPLWTKYFTTSEYDRIKANRMAVDAAGNLYVTGRRARWDETTQTDESRMFLIRYNADGVMAWKYSGPLYTEGYSVAADASGHVYVAGSSGTYMTGGNDAWMAKFSVTSSSATLLWENLNDGAANEYDSAYGVAVAGSMAYFAGYSTEQTGDGGVWLGKYDGSGVLVSSRSISNAPGEEAAYGVAVSPVTGSIYVAGQAINNDYGTYDGVVYISSADLSDFGVTVSTYHSASTQWGRAAAYGLTLDAAGAVYVTGTDDRSDIGWGRDLWLRKYTSQLGADSELWTQTFNSNGQDDAGYSVALDSSGYVYAAGAFGMGDGVYRYKQASNLAYNPTLTARIMRGAPGTTDTTPFAGVSVAFIPYSQTGGIDAYGVRMGSTNASGYFTREMAPGRQYFIAVATQGYTPTVKDQQIDPNGTYFVQFAGDYEKTFTLYPAADPGNALSVTVTSATAGDLVTAEVFFTETGEKMAYAMAQVPASTTTVTFTVPSVATAAANVYTLGVTIPSRSVQRSRKLDSAFPSSRNAYDVCMSTTDGAIISSAGFDVTASTVPASFSGVVRNSATNAPVENVRVSLYHQDCVPEVKNNAYDEYQMLTDVNGKFSFYGVTPSTVPYLATLRKAGYGATGMGWCQYFVSSSVVNGGVTVSQGGGFNYQDFSLAEATFTFKGIVTYDNVPIPNANVMVHGDYTWYTGGSDSYRQGQGMGTDAKIRTGADGSFTFSSATANGLLEGGLRLNVDFLGSWRQFNEGRTNSNTVDSDDIRIVISGQRSTTTVSGCANGKVWMLSATDGSCRAAVYPGTPLVLNIEPPAGESRIGRIYGDLVFVTTYTVTEQSPLLISTAAPVTVMAMANCEGSCSNTQMGFVTLSGAYTVNTATYSISLATGTNYDVKLVSTEWGLTSSFDMDVDLQSTDTARVNFTVGRAGKLTGNILLPSGASYRPNLVSEDDPAFHSMYITIKGQQMDVFEKTMPDENGEFEFPNIAPGSYDLALVPRGDGFSWPPLTMEGITVASGRTTQVKPQLGEGLVVQPQIVGLPEQSTPTWRYLMIPVESGTEMNQKKVSELFFAEDSFAFGYATATATWDKKYMQPGQYDFYLVLRAQYNPGSEGSFSQFGNFIGKIKGVTIQRSEANPGLGSYAQPISVSILGAIGQGVFNGTLTGAKVFTENDCQRFFGNFNEMFSVIPAVMVYDGAGDLKGYTAAMPTEADLPGFLSVMQAQDLEGCKNYFVAHPAAFVMPGLPPGNYTAVFNNPNYPPVAKELSLPYENYAFDFDAQNLLSGSISGTIKSSSTLEAVANATVFLKHRTVEKYVNSASDGSFRFENLPAGIYRLEVLHSGFVKAGAKTSLSASDAASLSFYLIPSEAIMSGKVYMSKFPSPVTKAGVKIVAYDETLNVEAPSAYLPKIEANTNSSGEYELPGIIPGHLYKVSAFYPGKLTTTLDVTAVDGYTYIDDIVLSDIRPQITVKAKKSPDSASKVDVTIKSPKKLVTAPVCKFNPSGAAAEYLPATAVTLALVPGPNNTYNGQFTVSRSQRYYTVYVLAGDTDKTEKTVLYDQNNEARTDQYIQDESIRGGEVQMDVESEEYSGIELDPGSISYSTNPAGTSAYSVSAAGGDLVGGFFSSLPSVRTVKTAKGNLTIEAAVQDLMASEVYDMDLDNASVNKPITLTLKYDKEKGAGANLKIYRRNPETGEWEEVPGNYTVDPMLGVVSVDVECLDHAQDCQGASNTPLGRKRYGMSAVVNGRYVMPASGTGTQSGQFAVFTAKPATGIAYTGGFDVYNLPNPFSLKNKTVTNIQGTGAFTGLSGYNSGAQSYTVKGTLLKYHLPPGKSGNLKFVIYNLAGEKVRTIDDSHRDGGWIYYSEWDGKNDNGADCASGVYFMLTYLDGKQLGTKAHKMALIK